MCIRDRCWVCLEVGVGGDNLRKSLAGSRRDGKTSTETAESKESSDDSNTVMQNIANFFTPNDGKSYKDGKLVDDE